jgi:hypothetical protein
MRNVAAAAVLIGFLQFGPCLAQDADTAESRAEAALALQQAMGGSTAVIHVFASLRPTLIKLIMQAGHLTLSHAAEMVDKVEIPDLQKAVPEMLAARAKILAKYYTVHDMQVMTAFYRSPTGQRVLANQGAISAEFLASMQPLLRDVQAHAAELAKKQAEGTDRPTQPAP